MSEDPTSTSADVRPFPFARRNDHVQLIALHLLALSEEKAEAYWQGTVSGIAEATRSLGFGEDVVRWQIAELRKAVDAEMVRRRQAWFDRPDGRAA